MDKLTYDVKHESERGVLLLILIRRGLDWVPVTELQKQMARQGYPMVIEDLDFHTKYCLDGGYVEAKSLRSGRADVELRVVRATKRAVDLRDGRLPADPGIAF